MPMKEKIVACLMMVSFFGMVICNSSCISEEEPRGGAPAATSTPAAPAASDNDLVYLKVEHAVASSFEETPDWAPKPDPMAPVDGDLQTRWSPQYNDNEWIYFDFGKPKTISKVIIRWEEAYASKYEILTSDVAKEWKRLLFVENGKGGVEEHAVGPVTAQYVKLVGTERVNPDWGFSIWEFESYGPNSANPDDKTLEETFPARVGAAKASLGAGMTFAPGEIVPSPGALTRTEFQKGVVYTSWSTSELSGPTSDASLEYLSRLGVKHVALMVVWYQPDIEAKEMVFDEKKTVSDEAIIHAVNVCHKLGMKVRLKPHVDVQNEEARQNIIASEVWFDAYKKYIVRYAELAQKCNIELFSVGTELANTSIEQWHARWSDIIRAVRAAYKGPLAYDSNWDEFQTVSFWKEVDYIGMDAYFPITNSNDPTKEQLIEGWKSRADEIEGWMKSANLSDMPVIFTEIGYDAVDGSNTQPWRILPTLANAKEDQQEQADCLDSMMIVLSTRGWFKGFYWWNYFPRPDLGPMGYTLRGKKGEGILVDWFKKMK